MFPASSDLNEENIEVLLDRLAKEFDTGLKIAFISLIPRKIMFAASTAESENLSFILDIWERIIDYATEAILLISAVITLADRADVMTICASARTNNLIAIVKYKDGGKKIYNRIVDNGQTRWNLRGAFRVMRIEKPNCLNN